MTPFGKTVATELRSAIVPLETASIADYRYLDSAIRALVKNALFFVMPDPAIEAARDRVIGEAHALAEAIRAVGVQPQGISLGVDQARADAIVAMQDLIDVAANAEPTVAGRSLGVG